jgi:replicative DNA helicase
MLDTGSERCQKALAMLKPESFYLRAHQVIFAEMRELVAKRPVDLITLVESLEAKSMGEQAGGFAYMAEMSKNTPAQQTSFTTPWWFARRPWSATAST